MKKSLFTLFLVVLTTICLSAQNTQDYSIYAEAENDYVVIALSGLKLREKPLFDAKSLTTMPLGAKVTLIYGNLYGYTAEEDAKVDKSRLASHISDGDTIGGFWVKVNYKNLTGWCFGSYLGKGILKMTKPYYFLMEYAGCQEVSYVSSSYNYYGVYKGELKKIKPIFYSHELGTEIKAAGNVRPDYIIASKIPISEGIIASTFHYKEIIKNEYSNYIWTKPLLDYINKQENTYDNSQKRLHSTALQLNTNWTLKFVKQKNKNKELSEETDPYDYVLKLTDGKISQILVTMEFTSEFYLYWEGDIDRDGRTDFIIQNSDEHSSGYSLYLSSLAKPNELVGFAGIFGFNDCC